MASVKDLVKKRNRGRRPALDFRAQVVLKLDRPKNRKVSDAVVSQIVDEWIVSGDLPEFAQIRMIRWRIKEGGRERAGVVTDEGKFEEVRATMLERFRGGGRISSVLHVGKNKGEGRAEEAVDR